MQTLFTVEDKETGSIKTLLHVTTVTKIGLSLIIYISDEYGNHKKTIRKSFINKNDLDYHTELRKNIVKDKGIIHARVSDTPLVKSIQKPITYYSERDSKGRFIKHE